MQTHSETPARLLRIRGLVQGVGYRNALLREATRLGLSGWVRNRSDGSVEALVAGHRRALRRAHQAVLHELRWRRRHLSRHFRRPRRGDHARRLLRLAGNGRTRRRFGPCSRGSGR